MAGELKLKQEVVVVARSRSKLSVDDCDEPRLLMLHGMSASAGTLYLNDYVSLTSLEGARRLPQHSPAASVRRLYLAVRVC